jgi:dual-specificity kinase
LLRCAPLRAERVPALPPLAVLHSQRLVHTDLKPENVLLLATGYDKEPVAPGSKHMTRVPHSSAIRLIDFGSATWEAQYHSTVVSTRHYRAPEVILGLSWSYPCDIWSVGCILVELLTGDALFQTHENLEHLAMMEVVLGPIPPALIARADRHAQSHYFRHARELNWPEGSSSRDSVRAVRKLRRLGELVAAQAAGARAGAGAALADLVAGLLQYEPGARLTAAQALRHPFFAEGGGAGGAGAGAAGASGAGALPPPLPPPPPPQLPPPAAAGGAARTRSAAGEARAPPAELPRRPHATKAC